VASSSIERFTVRYYEAKFYDDGKPKRFSDFLQKIISGDIALPVRSLAGDTSAFQVRGLHTVDNGQEYRGYFVRFRSQRPVIGTRESLDEKHLELKEGEEILERNYFTIFAGERYDVIAFQVSFEGGSINALVRYLSAIAGDTAMVSFNDILTEESLEALMKGGVIKHVEFRVAKPRAKRWQPDPEDTWTQNAIDFMNQTGGTTFQAKIATQAHNKGLLSDVGKAVKALLASSQTRKLKVKMSSTTEPIDLFADRIKDRIEVALINGQIDSTEMYKAIWASKMKIEPALAAYLDSKHETLD